MDHLAKRYGDPCFLLDGYIQTGRFCVFVEGFLEQQQEDETWEFFLHRVWDKSYNEFRDELKTTQSLKTMSERTMEATVKKSMDILENFQPDQEEGE
jgi:hypothetical protein